VNTPAYRIRAYDEIMSGDLGQRRRSPAPQPLRLVQLFLNTWDREARHEGLRTPGKLGRWLVEQGLASAPGTVTGTDWQRALALREGLRALALANNDGRHDAETLTTAAAALEELAVSLVLTPSGKLRLTAPTGFGQAAATILGAVQIGMADGRWKRMKACRLDECQWVFYDASRNRSGRWCTPDLCGTRIRNRRAYQRRRARPAGSDESAGVTAEGGG
jgi:predicted RNA-binding Zn ribbon-like protein